MLGRLGRPEDALPLLTPGLDDLALMTPGLADLLLTTPGLADLLLLTVLLLPETIAAPAAAAAAASLATARILGTHAGLLSAIWCSRAVNSFRST